MIQGPDFKNNLVQINCANEHTCPTKLQFRRCGQDLGGAGQRVPGWPVPPHAQKLQSLFRSFRAHTLREGHPQLGQQTGIFLNLCTIPTKVSYLWYLINRGFHTIFFVTLKAGEGQRVIRIFVWDNENKCFLTNAQSNHCRQIIYFYTSLGRATLIYRGGRTFFARQPVLSMWPCLHWFFTYPSSIEEASTRGHT